MNKYRRQEDDPRKDEKYGSKYGRRDMSEENEEQEEEPMEAACGGYAGGMGMMGEGLMGPDVLTATMYSGKDPVSGNPVPVGADEDNVRDDIPAMISEGEYVLPADVVKYHGLKGILDFQNEARQGLMSMAMTGLIQNVDPTMDEEDAEDEEDDETPEYSEMLAEQQGQQQKAEDGEQQQTASNPEDESFKKRYGDLRRHLQYKEQQYQQQIDELKNQLDSATKEQIKFPKTDEEVEQWAKRYPDVAAIIDTIARKRAGEMLSEGEKRLEKVEEMRDQVVREKAEQELMRLHPDFSEIRQDPAFHEWAQMQSQWVQNALYKNNTDAKAASEAIDLYKYHKGIKARKKSAKKDAAAAVDTRGGAAPSGGTRKKFSESMVQNMSAKDYEKNEEAIFEAMRKGEFDYDLSGGAR